MNVTAGRLLTASLVASILNVAGAENWSPPRTFDGKPGFEGVWTNASITTLQRPAQYKSLVIPRADVERETALHPQVVRQRTDDGLDAHVKLDGSDLKRGRGYNAFWIAPGMEFGLVKGERRTSWIIDPADGRMPLSANGHSLLAALAKKHERFDGPETRPLPERCIIIGGRVGPPMINGLYNNNYEIVQGPDTIVIRVEMISHARIVRMNSTHLPAQLAQVFGDSIGHWEGDTLVIETTHFHAHQQDSMVPLTSTGKVIERLTRVSSDQLLYEFTVDDPALYSRPWRGEMTFTASAERVFEYACHEGNYALTGVLAGARQQENVED
jgi:hypothetical protein